MTHYDIDYSKMTEAEGDKKAINDIREWNPRALDLMTQAVENGEFKNFEQISVLFALVGVQGRPVHAFGRIYCRPLYDAWMATA